MPNLDKLVDNKGHVLCRYCWFSLYGTLSASGLCSMGDNPGPVDLDIAECFEGELAPEDQWWDREQWGK